MRIAVAFDSYKGSVDGWQASCHASSALQAVGIDAYALPLADGGEGTARVLGCLSGGEEHSISAIDAYGAEAEVSFVILSDGSVVMDMASSCGLGGREGTLEAKVMLASSYGLGVALRGICERFSPCRVIIGLGGTATCDGGVGFLQALGVRLHFDGAMPQMAMAADLGRVMGVERPDNLSLPEITFLRDVDAPLTGVEGAARRFAPQKGASPLEVEWLEKAMTRWGEMVLGRYCDIPGAGAAGGMPVAAAVIGAKVESGARYITSLLAPRLQGADLVVTGEGRTDLSTLQGKAPYALACRARDLGVPVWLVSGQITLSPQELLQAGFERAFPLVKGNVSPTDLDVDVTLSRIAELLTSHCGF